MKIRCSAARKSEAFSTFDQLPPIWADMFYAKISPIYNFPFHSINLQVFKKRERGGQKMRCWTLTGEWPKPRIKVCGSDSIQARNINQDLGFRQCRGTCAADKKSACWSHALVLSRLASIFWQKERPLHAEKSSHEFLPRFCRRSATCFKRSRKCRCIIDTRHIGIKRKIAHRTLEI